MKVRTVESIGLKNNLVPAEVEVELLRILKTAQSSRQRLFKREQFEVKLKLNHRRVTWGI